MVKIQRCVLCGPKDNDDGSIAHFKFPKHNFEKWKSFCLKLNPSVEVFKSSKLCCIHFAENSFSSLYHRHYLKKDAIPSVIPHHTYSLSRKCSHNLLENKPNVIKEPKKYTHSTRAHCFLCKTNKTGIAHFRFPKDDSIRQQWIDFCQINGCKIYDHWRLCQHHFADDDFCVTNCGKVMLKSKTVPSRRTPLQNNTSGNEDYTTSDERDEDANTFDIFIPDISINEDHSSSFMHSEESNDLEVVLPPKGLKLCSDMRCDDAGSYHTSAICGVDMYQGENENDAGTSASCILEPHRCSFCTISSRDVFLFRFPNNPDLRSFFHIKCGLQKRFLERSHYVCLSHFHASDIIVDDNGEKIVKDGALPWSVLSQLNSHSVNTPSLSPIVNTVAQSLVNTPRVRPADSETEVETVTPVKSPRKRKAYIGDLTPSDFRTPRSVQKNLTFVKEKFRDVSIKVKRLQDANRHTGRQLKKIKDMVRVLKGKGSTTNKVSTTTNEFADNYDQFWRNSIQIEFSD